MLIVDVPCSGLGVIAKKQDIKYRVTRESLKEITALQREIISNVVQYLKPGAVMMYSTCTINPDENERMADWICQEFHMEPVSMTDKLPEELRREGECGYLQLLPGVHDTDGFFIAKLRSRNSYA